MQDMSLCRHRPGLQGKIQWDYPQNGFRNAIGIMDLFPSTDMSLPNSQFFCQGKLYKSGCRTSVHSSPDFTIPNMNGNMKRGFSRIPDNIAICDGDSGRGTGQSCD